MGGGTWYVANGTEEMYVQFSVGDLNNRLTGKSRRR
jgi:hypothetical protein